LLIDLKGLMAVVSDENVQTPARKFSWDQVKALVDLIEQDLIRPNTEHVSLYVDGAPVALTSFPRQIVRNLLVALVSSLKGAADPRSLEFRVSRRR
jgi:hypothetical protein